MRASTPKKRRNLRWQKYALDLVKAGDMLRDYAIGIEGDPVSAFAWFDTSDRHRRIVATYEGGYGLQVNFTNGGAVSSYKLGIKVVARKRARA